MKKRSTLSKLVPMFLFMLICTLAFSVNVSAKSKKAKALAAYKTFLSKPSKVYTSESDEDYKEHRKFAIAYINNDNIPELVLFDYIVNGGDAAYLYTYKNGKVKKLGTINYGDGYSKKSKVAYVKKGNLIRDFYDDDASANIINYLRIENNKLKTLKYYEISPYNKKEFASSYSFTNVSKKNIKKLSKPIYAKFVRYSNSGKTVFKKISKATYKADVKLYSKSKKFVKFELHKNTKKNREKYLK